MSPSVIHTDIAMMESIAAGDRDPDIAAAEARLRSAQLAADTAELERLISDDLLFAGADGRLASKTQDLEAHASGLVRFREHEPQELRIQRLGESVAITSLRARLAVEVAGKVTRGVYRYTRVWHRVGDDWRVAGGHVSEVAR